MEKLKLVMTQSLPWPIKRKNNDDTNANRDHITKYLLLQYFCLCNPLAICNRK